MKIDHQLEGRVRAILARLEPGGTVSTRELGERLGTEVPAETARMLLALADNVPGLATTREEVAAKGPMQGRTIKRRIWHALSSAVVPDTRREDVAPATSLVDAVAHQGQRLRTLEDRIADIEARFNPLSRVL